jgi:hypothetical protein
MAIAAVMGFFVSRIVLTALFYLVITPMGFVVRLSGQDLLDERIDRKKTSYWKKHEGNKDKRSYENQF